MRRSIVACTAVAVTVIAAASAEAGANKSGFRTAEASMLAPVMPGVTTTPLLTVCDTLSSGYRFESIPPRRGACAAVAVTVTGAASAEAGANPSAFRAAEASMLAPVMPGVTTPPLLTVGDTLASGYRFESIPDGIAVRTKGRGRADLYIN